MNEFFEAWHFLNDHKIFKNEYKSSRFNQDLYVWVTKVNPETEEIDDDKSKNTKVEIWLECGPYEFYPFFGEYMSSHDPKLDCGGDTYEEAIIELAKLVKKHYGE